MASFLVDECVARDVHEALQQLGHEVTLVSAHLQGASDEQIFEFATQHGLIVLSEDRRFGSVALNSPVRPATGVVIILMGTASPPEKARRVASVMPGLVDSLPNNITVVGPTIIRRRPL